MGGQLNIGRTLDLSQIVTPPTGVDGFYNLGGDLYRIDDVGNTFSVITSGITGTGSQNFLPVWTSVSSLGSSNIQLKQIAITVSTTDMNSLHTTGKQLLTGGGSGIVNVVHNAYIKVNPISGTQTNTLAYIFTGGPGGPPSLMQCNPFGNSVGNERRYVFTPVDTTNAVSDDYNLIDNNEVLLKAQNQLTGGSASAVVYLTYYVIDENNMNY
jgi:hypothetical protein